MAGKEQNMELSMDMINVGTSLDLSKIEAEVIEETPIVDTPPKDNLLQQNTNKDITDGAGQEIVGSDAEKLLEQDKSGTESPANSDNVFKSFAGFISEKGLLSASEEDLAAVKDEDTFAELVKKQIKDNEYADLNESQVKYLEAIREGVPAEVFHENLQANTAYEQLTDDLVKGDPGVRKDLIVAGYVAKGFDENYALKQYKRVSDSNEDVEEALMFRDDLKRLQDERYTAEVARVKQAQDDAKAANQKQIDDFKTSVYAKEKVLKDFKVTKGIQDKVYSLMTKPVEYTKAGEPINAMMKDRIDNPVEFETNLYYLYEITNGFKDLGALSKKAASKVTNNFQATLEKSNYIESSQSNPFLKSDEDTTPIVITDII